MSFFDKIFGEKQQEKQSKSFWNLIESEKDLENAIKKSYDGKIAIFKHSTSCFISKTVLRNFEKEIDEADEKVATFYFLDLLAHRNLSNKIAEDFGIRHESPQLIVIQNGNEVNNASHQDISLSQITL
ncbi:bacillithiol system redox-active protein YtxJ [Chryseobacterium chendengshani]|uniref:bacillithiol system redox-active protein YtxJ n=1 Tax=Chryseobacterium sp. LJ756 TaxID=2864113 RepID=UPI001C63E64F|nr:bacillithiol system redox-active protein YtxJ [Chryseobacterium sp. LJ756]MBW7674539.1 bacillithiol system redox-active protein YtxJ [Chryseobacterium sp. LJ756]